MGKNQKRFVAGFSEKLCPLPVEELFFELKSDAACDNSKKFMSVHHASVNLVHFNATITSEKQEIHFVK